MFERYTESARRTLFFARFEASQVSATSIEPEHVLAGLMRDHAGLVRGILKDAGITPAEVRADLPPSAIPKPKTPTHVEMPFSVPVQRLLQFAAEEADAMRLGYIGSEHLLLALLREEQTMVWDILTKRGLSLTQARRKVVELTAGNPRDVEKTTPISGDARLRAARRVQEIRLALNMLGTLDLPQPDTAADPIIRQLLDQLDALERDLDL
jgi:ATP-dependent Clp protease ATP-binding subunit ClpC